MSELLFNYQKLNQKNQHTVTRDEIFEKATEF